MHQEWKYCGMFEIMEKHLACKVQPILKTEKLSKVKKEDLKKRISVKGTAQKKFDPGSKH